MNILATIFGIFVLYISYCLLALLQNYQKAAALNVPIRIALISPDNHLWIALQTGLSFLIRKLPLEKFSLLRHCRLGWEFHDRYQTTYELGDVYVLVTPVRIWIHVCNAEAVQEVLSRHRDFDRPLWMLEMLDVFGPNVSTAGGSNWQRQRKLTAAPFNEQKSPLVWDESLRQAKDMLRYWTSSTTEGITTSTDDSRTLALDVLAYVGFQHSYEWRSVPSTDSEQNEVMTYRDSLSLILQNILTILVLPSFFFKIPMLPVKVKRIGSAISYFREHMMSQIEEEKKLATKGLKNSSTLVGSLVKASMEQKQQTSSQLKPLSVDEMLGNIFVFNFAGHDTTAITMSYALTLLVARPDVQDWVHEEIAYYLRDPESSHWDYGAVFPNLKRCLAVLLETLRLYNPLLGVPKYTNSPQTLRVHDKTIAVPPDTLVVPMLQSVHTDPRYWGKNSLTWEPSRWIAKEDSTSGLPNEKLFEQVKGAFVPWSEGGSRHCPGKKFAQVEFVAVMATLFRDHVARISLREGESPQQARKRALDVVANSEVNLLLEMQDARSVAFNWSKR